LPRRFFVGATVRVAAEEFARPVYAFALGHMDGAKSAGQDAFGRLDLVRGAAKPEIPPRPPFVAALARALPEQEAEQAAQDEPQYAEADEDDNEEKEQDQFEHA
jgi:hypothetical protein